MVRPKPPDQPVQTLEDPYIADVIITATALLNRLDSHDDPTKELEELRQALLNLTNEGIK